MRELLAEGPLEGVEAVDPAEQDERHGEGFEFVAKARALLREPDLVQKMEAGSSAVGLCIHSNKCMPTIYAGTHCVLAPPSEWPSALRVH